MKESSYIWKNGELIAWQDATTHVLSHTLHYGNAAFEGTRAYMTPRGLAVFRLRDHCERLLRSCKILRLECPYTYEDLERAHIALLQANRECFTSSVYIRPLVYLGYGVMGLSHINAPVDTIIAAWEWGAYLGDDGLENGIKVKTSSLSRNPIRATMGKAKAAANYLNSQLAKYEAIACGCDEALLLDEQGFVAEGSGECIFLIRDGKLITPPHDYTLESITQATAIMLARDVGLEVVERNITRDELYVADEAFFTGTAAEITPIREVDFYTIGTGAVGEITKALQAEFHALTNGQKEQNPKYAGFLTFVDEIQA